MPYRLSTLLTVLLLLFTPAAFAQINIQLWNNDIGQTSREWSLMSTFL